MYGVGSAAQAVNGSGGVALPCKIGTRKTNTAAEASASASSFDRFGICFRKKNFDRSAAFLSIYNVRRFKMNDNDMVKMIALSPFLAVLAALFWAMLS